MFECLGDRVPQEQHRRCRLRQGGGCGPRTRTRTSTGGVPLLPFISLYLPPSLSLSLSFSHSPSLSLSPNINKKLICLLQEALEPIRKTLPYAMINAMSEIRYKEMEEVWNIHKILQNGSQTEAVGLGNIETLKTTN